MNTACNLNQEAEWDTQQEKVAPMSMTHPFEHLCFSGLHRHYRNIVLLFFNFFVYYYDCFFALGVLLLFKMAKTSIRTHYKPGGYI